MRKAGGTTLRTALEKLYFDKRLEILVRQKDGKTQNLGGFTLHHQVSIPYLQSIFNSFFFLNSLSTLLLPT
jgi:hypothetical protein